MYLTIWTVQTIEAITQNGALMSFHILAASPPSVGLNPCYEKDANTVTQLAFWQGYTMQLSQREQRRTVWSRSKGCGVGQTTLAVAHPFVAEYELRVAIITFLS